MHTILLVEDDPVQRAITQMALTKKLGYEVVQAEHGREAVDIISRSNVGDISAILLDINMPVMDGFEALAAIRIQRPDIPILMLTGQDDTAIAVKAIKEGANDFIIKPPHPDQLDIALKNAIKFSTLARELSRLKRDRQGTLSFDDMIGCAGGLKEQVAIGRKAANSDVPVLITGETGVGKELFARAVHGESRRAGSPFITVNCGAIPKHLVESILFGHEKGAFTGAIARTLGKFREAEGGTIFLDELGELPLDAQVKLLRVLQEKEVEPVGAAHNVKVNVRVIAATNRQLKKDVQEGRFREDLYFRVNVLPIVLPPLRARKQDIIALAEYFIASICTSDMLDYKALTEDAKTYLLRYDWPGNVREMENLLHRLLVLSDRDVIDEPQLVALHDTADLPAAARILERSPMTVSLLDDARQCKSMATLEHEIMQAVLHYCDQNVGQAAQSLRMAKSTFYRKLKESDSSSEL